MNNRLRAYFIALLFFFFPILANSQTLKGRVNGMDGRAIENANVVLQDTSGNTLNYGFTNGQGIFSVKNVNNVNPVRLIISAFNYEKVVRNVIASTEQQHFILKEKIIDLKEVSVKAPPVSSRGDTINYDVDFFKKPQNRVIGDVLKNIPGIQISSKGQISYNGQPINKFYIDGDDLLGGKYNLAQNTIPADLVEKVQIFERHQPIEVLRKIVPSQNPALNLILKDKAKLKLIGELEFSGGTAHNYLANSNTLLLKNKFKTINRVGYNSTAINFKEELIDHSLSSLLDGLNRPFSSPVFSPQNIMDPSIGLSRWPINYTGAIHLNGLFKIAEKQTMKVNVAYIPEKTIRAYKSFSNYYLPIGNVQQLEEQKLDFMNHTLQGVADYEKNSKEIYIQNKTSINIEESKFNGKILSEKGLVNQNGTTENNQFDNTFALIKLIKKDMVLSVRNKIGYNTLPEHVLISPNVFLPPYSSTTNNQLSQNINKRSKFTTNKVSVGLNQGKIRQTYAAEFNLFDSDFESDQETNLNAQTFSSDLNHTNELNVNKAQVLFNPGYLLTINKFQLNVGASLKGERYSIVDYVRTTKTDTLIFQPLINVNLEIKPSVKHTLQLNISNDFSTGQAEDFLQGLLVRNYRTAASNDFLINSSKTISSGLFYSFRDAIKILFASGSFNYMNSRQNTMNQSIIDIDGNLAYKRILLKNTTERFMLNLKASKYIYALNTTAKFSVDVNFSNQNILQNTNLQDYKNSNYTLSLAFDSKISEKFNFNLEGKQNFGSAKTTSALQPFKTSSRFGQYKTTVAYQFQRTMIVETNFEYQYFRAIGGKTNYFFNEAKVTYTQPKSKTAYILGLSNTLNAKSFISQSIDANSDFYQEYFLRPRVIYLSVKFLL